MAGLDEKTRLWSGPMVQGEDLTEIGSGPGQSRPSFGRGEDVWALDANGVLQRTTPDGIATEVPVEGLPDRVEIDSVALSRDGTRIALVTRRGPRAILFIAVVVQREGIRIVTNPVRAESRLTEFVDVAWFQDDLLVAIASEGAAKPDPV